MAAQGLGHDTHGLSLDRVHARKRPSLPSWHLVSFHWIPHGNGKGALLHYMFPSGLHDPERGKNAFAVARAASVGAARVDTAEIAAVAVVRAAEPPPQWNTQTSVFKRTFPCRLQRNRRMPVSPPVQAVHNRDGARIWFWYGLSTVCFSIHFPPCLFVSFRGLAVCYCPIHCIFFLS